MHACNFCITDIARFGQFYVLSGLFLMQTTPSLAIVFAICPRSKWRTCKGGGEPGGTRDVKNTNRFWVESDNSPLDTYEASIGCPKKI